jgi:hypothetical protein
MIVLFSQHVTIPWAGNEVGLDCVGGLGLGNLKAAYRLLDRAEVTFPSVAEVHWRQTRRRSAGRYLVLGDTTELDFGVQREIPDLGPTGNGGGWGFLLHSALLVAAEGEETFGLAGQTIHYRKPRPKKENATQRLGRDRESKVWGEVIDAVGRPAEDVELVHVLDRGADNFEVYCHCLEQATDWVVRVAQKQRNILTPDDEHLPLKSYLETLPLSGTYELLLRARPGQAARTAQLQVRHGALRMPLPAHRSPYVKRINPSPIEMHVVAVREVDAPAGVEPIEWTLLTSLVVEDFEDAWVVIGYYEKRWRIEKCFSAATPAARIIRVTVCRLAKTQPVRTVVKLAKLGAVIVADSPCNNSTKPGTSSTVSLLARCLRVMSQAFCRRLALLTQTSC